MYEIGPNLSMVLMAILTVVFIAVLDILAQEGEEK